MTVVVFGRADNPWISGFAGFLRQRGFTVIALQSIGLVGFLLHSQRIGALVVHEDDAPAGWERLRERLASVSSVTRIVQVARDDTRTFDQLAAAMVP